MLYALSFPKFSLSFLGFLFLVPLLYYLEQVRTREYPSPQPAQQTQQTQQNQKNKTKQRKQRKPQGFLLFFLFSFFSYLVILYWLPRVMVHYGNMALELSIFSLVVLAAFLSLFNGLAGMLINKAALFMIPFIWIGKDLVIEKIFGGFPWCLAGYSQYKNLYFIQSAEIGGIHLVSFVLIGFNVLFYKLIRDWRRQHRRRSTLVFILAGLLAMYALGYVLSYLNSRRIAPLPTHQAGIIQPNTDNNPISHEEKARILQRLLAESRELTQKGAEFIVWPEHTTSIYPLQNSGHYELLTRFARENVPLLAGFTDLQSYSEIYNSAILFRPDGIEKYDKVHLTPFGEYILFRKLLFFVKRITDEIADFKPGTLVRNIHIQGHPVATPICYEIIYPELVRKFVSLDGELIITISNDAWFGNTSAPYQHLSMAVFRCIENRRYILRSTTNGISAVIAPSGQILYQSPYHQPDHFIGSFKYLRTRTVFTVCGYLFPYFCLLAVAVYFGIRNYRAFGRPD